MHSRSMIRDRDFQTRFKNISKRSGKPFLNSLSFIIRDIIRILSFFKNIQNEHKVPQQNEVFGWNL